MKSFKTFIQEAQEYVLRWNDGKKESEQTFKSFKEASDRRTKLKKNGYTVSLEINLLQNEEKLFFRKKKYPVKSKPVIDTDK